MGPKLRTAVALTALLALSGCGTVAPVEVSPTPSPTPSVSTASVTPPTPSLSPSATPEPTQELEVALSGSGIAGLRFGASEDEVEALLVARLGSPQDSHTGPACELDTGSPWSRSLLYGGLSVMFTAKNTSRSAPRTLAAWAFSTERELPPPLVVDAAVPLDATFAELKKAYPKGTTTETGIGDDSVVFSTGDGLRFIGVERPELVQAGKQLFCE